MTKKLSLVFPLLLVAYEMAVYLSNDMYLPALPSMQKDLGLDVWHVQFTLTAWFSGAACLQWLIGPLTDRFGRRPVVLWGGIGFLISCIVCVFTHNITMMLIARFIQGSTVCSVIVGGYAAIHEAYEGKQAVKILALMSFITITAPAVGPVLGAGILLFASWRSLFGLLAFGAALALLGLVYKMPETLTEPHQLNMRNTAQAYWAAIKKSSFSLPILANCCTFGMLISWLTFGPFLIINHYHLTPQLYALTQVIVFGGYMLGNRMIPILLKKLSMKRIVLLGTNIGIVAGVITILVANNLSLDHHHFPWGILFGVCGIAFGAGFCGPNLQRLAMDASPKPMGIKMAIYSSMISITGASVSAMVTRLETNQWQNILTLMLVFMGIALALHLSNDGLEKQKKILIKQT